MTVDSIGGQTEARQQLTAMTVRADRFDTANKVSGSDVTDLPPKVTLHQSQGAFQLSLESGPPCVGVHLLFITHDDAPEIAAGCYALTSRVAG